MSAQPGGGGSSLRTVLKTVVVLAVLAVMVPVWRVATWRPLPVPAAVLPDRFVRVAGVAHVHTTLSDGAGTLPEVEAAAAAAGLDFIIVTDHNSLAGKPAEGYGASGVLTIVGTEISNHEGHLLAMGLPKPTYRFSGDSLDALHDIDELGGLVFAAHPDNPRDDLQWTGWDLPGTWGLEILNGDSQWRAAGWAGLLGVVLRYPLHRDYALLRMLHRPTALDRWDDLLARRHATGIAGADAHGPAAPLPIPSYEALFRIAQNQVLLDDPLTGDAVNDIAALRTALARGRSYVGLGALAPAGGFFFVAERGSQQWTMGDTVPAGDPLRLRAGGALPANAEVTLRRDGAVIASNRTVLDRQITDTGVYRVEVQLPGWQVPWIISNPIYVLAIEEREQRATAGLLPEPPRADAVNSLERFDTGTLLEAVSDGSTTLDPQFIVPGSGPDGSPAARVSFHLGAPSPEYPSPFASLGTYEPRDLSERRGLILRVRSDRQYRFWLQVRDANPAAPEGVESWYTSVKTTTEWRQVTVPFDRLYSVTPEGDGSLDLTSIRAIIFLVDIGAVPPGTDGEIWIDDLGVY